MNKICLWITDAHYDIKHAKVQNDYFYNRSHSQNQGQRCGVTRKGFNKDL